MRQYTQRLLKHVKRDRYLYLMLIPGLLFFVIFKYIPMYGIVIAFQDFKIGTGILGSRWVGFAHFIKFFSSDDFGRIFYNTVVISFYKLLIGFPIPILFAILLNELRSIAFKRTVQTLSLIHI